jgi:hypothetical protein
MINIYMAYFTKDFLGLAPTVCIDSRDINIMLPNGMYITEIRYEHDMLGNISGSGSFIIPNISAYTANIESERPVFIKPAPPPIPERTRILDLD